MIYSVYIYFFLGAAVVSVQGLTDLLDIFVGVQGPVPTSSTVAVNVFGPPEPFSQQGAPPGWLG